MNSFDVVNESFEKIASRAWKRNIGKLGEDGVKRLTDSGILNHGREYMGIKRGTRNIVAKNNGVIDSKGKLVRKSLKDTTKKMFKSKQVDDSVRGSLAASTGKKPSKLAVIASKTIGKAVSNASTSLMRRGGRNFVTKLPDNLSGKSKGVIGSGDFFKKSYNPKDVLADLASGNQIKKFRESAGKDMSKFEKSYVNALLERHEADELRAGVKLMRKGKTKQYGDIRNPESRRFSTHIDPEVVHRESANVAVAPKGVKNVFSKIRNMTGENDAFEAVGLKYGKSGRYNKKLAKKHGDVIESYNKSLATK